MHIEISCIGDHVWKHTFSTRNDAYQFLCTLIGKLYLYYHATIDEDILFIYDSEDDMIVWREYDGPKVTTYYCAGWHHLDYGPDSGKDQLLLHGVHLATLLRNLQDNG